MGVELRGGSVVEDHGMRQLLYRCRLLLPLLAASSRDFLPLRISCDEEGLS